MKDIHSRCHQAIAWRTTRARVAKTSARLVRLARYLGFPEWPAEAPHDAIAFSPIEPPARRPLLGRSAVAAASVCTVDHLHFARTLASSFQVHHPDVPLFVLVVDGGPETYQIAGAKALTGTEIGFPRLAYSALKLNASELCCSAKPRILEHLLAHGDFEKILYLDADLQIFQPLDVMLEHLDSSSFVVTPHMLEPLPHPERSWEQPRLGQVATAGVFNAGLFGFKRDHIAQRFLDQWIDMVESPTAFSAAEHEQHSFNWISCFAENISILRDPAYNVAYWNLHERSLRAEQGTFHEPRFTVDGRPLVAFHFSGYDPLHPTQLSRWDSRHSIYHHEALGQLISQYSRRLAANASDGVSGQKYRFDSFPSGIHIDARMRRVFKQFQHALAADIDPWTKEGEQHYCTKLLQAIPTSGSLVPGILQAILDERSDLRNLCPDAESNPLPLIGWFHEWGALETGYSDLYARYRPVIPDWNGLLELSKLTNDRPADLLHSIEAPLGKGRTTFMTRLAGSDLSRSALARRFELYGYSPLALVRQAIDRNPQIREVYPDLLFSDAVRFQSWLELFGELRAFLPEASRRAFERTCEGRSLARIFTLLSRNWPLMEAFPLALVGHELDQISRTLLLHAGPEFDVDDIVMFRWLMEERPESGLELTLALPCNALRYDLEFDWADQDELLKPVLDRDQRIAAALYRYRSDRAELHKPRLRNRSWHVIEGSRSEHSKGRPAQLGAGSRAGVNLFGFFESPVGLGTMSHGIERALCSQSIDVARNLLPNFRMNADISPLGYVGCFDPDLDTNIFVNYPHNEEHLLRTRPLGQVEGRRNIAYLAWEQEKANSEWSHAYQEFDQIWALSDFAATALSKALEREVHSVPCVLDLDHLPQKASKSDFGLRHDRTIFLYTFDPSSSVERKNPLAAIEAFDQAFTPADKVQLLLRLAHFRPVEHRSVVERIANRANKTGLDIQIVTGAMNRRQILGLISAVDCYVSLHRAEGFGYTCAEAMAYALPTIATGYSGNLTFMNSACSFLVDFEKAEVLVPDGPFRRGSMWAEPKIDHAAHLMRQVLDHPDSAREIGRKGRARVADFLSAKRVGAVAASLLDDPPPVPLRSAVVE